MQTMRLIEAAKGFYQSIFERDKVIPAPIMPTERDVKSFEGIKVYVASWAKIDFSDGVNGYGGYDLSSAFVQKEIVLGDIVTHIYYEQTTTGEIKEKRVDLVYIGPADLKHGGRLGYHKFLREGKDAGRNVLYFGRANVRWEKTGHISKEEVLIRLDKSLKSKEPKY